MHAYRSHTCEALRASDVGATVRLSGRVHRVRDHGGVLFIDLRDHYGVTQVLADPDSPAFAAVEKVRAEWVIRIDGEVKARDPELVNPKIPTGEVEVFIENLPATATSMPHILYPPGTAYEAWQPGQPLDEKYARKLRIFLSPDFLRRDYWNRLVED